MSQSDAGTHAPNEAEIASRKREMRQREAPVTGPYWIVMRMSKWDMPLEYVVPPKHGGPRPRRYYRHPTQADAEAEAQRLAARTPGRRFTVYACCESYKVERAAAPAVGESA